MKNEIFNLKERNKTSMRDKTSIFNENKQEWTVSFPSGRQIIVSQEFLSDIYYISLIPDKDYEKILRSYQISTCPEITAWKKEHPNDISGRNITLEELEKMFFKDYDKYGEENVYQDIHENGIESIYFRDLPPGGWPIPNLPNWNKIITDKEAEDERDL